MILTISDGIENGKGGNHYVIFNYHFYIYQCKIINNNLLINNKIFNLNNITKIFFNYNEDLFTYNLRWDDKLVKRFKDVQEMIKLFKDIYNLVKEKYYNITIYHNPYKCFSLGDKVQSFKNIKNIKNDFVKSPKYIKIISDKTIDKINFYPVIIKISNGSHSKNDSICKNKTELIRCYNKYFKHNKNIICIEYIESFIKSLNSYVCVRLVVVNNRMLQFYAKPSDNWNIHVNIVEEKIKAADIYFRNLFKKNNNNIQMYINNIFSIYGNGCYSYDIIYNDDKNCFYICEIGLKYGYQTPRKISDTLNTNISVSSFKNIIKISN